MRHIKLTLQYDGTNYSGWQVQINAATIQGHLEDIILAITGEHSRVTGAGRTDAGVHALEQVAVFKTESRLDADILQRAINAHLPPDIRLMKAMECDEGFHPRYDAKSKTYSYVISGMDAYSVFLTRYSWNVRCQLDIEAMKEAAHYLRGTHDFSSFRASGCSSRHPVREITGINISAMNAIEFIDFRLDIPVIKIGITATAFLRHMARNIVGTLVEAGRNKLTPSRVKEILDARDRRLAGKTAPACGLFLEEIYY
ncbi:MAG TPA: tRNA pseudouridine(38-40) synthase TruA [Nitrospiraceae bacterium]|nr:tRNA pseudouridine(38-40) synthase TruA [Nitrospiraceae bacterium]